MSRNEIKGFCFATSKYPSCWVSHKSRHMRAQDFSLLSINHSQQAHFIETHPISYHLYLVTLRLLFRGCLTDAMSAPTMGLDPSFPVVLSPLTAYRSKPSHNSFRSLLSAQDSGQGVHLRTLFPMTLPSLEIPHPTNRFSSSPMGQVADLPGKMTIFVMTLKKNPFFPLSILLLENLSHL